MSGDRSVRLFALGVVVAAVALGGCDTRAVGGGGDDDAGTNGHDAGTLPDAAVDPDGGTFVDQIWGWHSSSRWGPTGSGSGPGGAGGCVRGSAGSDVKDAPALRASSWRPESGARRTRRRASGRPLPLPVWREA